MRANHEIEKKLKNNNLEGNIDVKIDSDIRNGLSKAVYIDKEVGNFSFRESWPCYNIHNKIKIFFRVQGTGRFKWP